MSDAERSSSRGVQAQRASSRLIGKVTQRVPLSVKRPLKRAVPRRYWRYFDPNWHRKAIGLPWAGMGELQFEFLVGQGLQPNHYLLDVGCGPLRGGVLFIDYLETGHYFGVEKRGDLLAAGRDIELPRHGLVEKRPMLLVMDDFDFRRLGRTFDYALAQSVFTHLPLNKVIRCLMRMEKALVEGGKFYASIWENEQGKWNLEPIQQRPDIATCFDENSYHYDFATFQWICEGTSLVPEYLGGWSNPRNQKMLVFTKKS